MAEQITVLLALSEELFDAISLEQMTEAEQAVREAAADIPAEVCARFESAKKLSKEDRDLIIQIASDTLSRFDPDHPDQSESSSQETL
jgi:F-type H+-transporting ATPase subunit alpha